MVIGGGKFGNGAVTAAYAYLFNQASRPRPPSDSHVLANPLKYINESYLNNKGNAECVNFAQQVGNAPLTQEWVPGEFISMDKPPPVGTWVATFVDGKYYGHVGAFYGYDNKGNLTLVDQFNFRGYVDKTTYYVKKEDYSGRISNDPSKYRVLKW